VSFRPAVLSYDDLRRLAEEFLEEFHEERTLPVPIEEIVEFDFEIEVVPMEGILDDLEVDAFLTSDLNQIYVDAFVLKHRYRRFRFSLAHELAHHELHRPLYEGTRIRSVRDWQAVQDSISEDDYAWFEFQANSLAGLVLAPTAELADQYRAAVRAAQEAGLSDETLKSEAGKAHIARWLADQFEVSELVIEKRMEKDGLWSPPSPPSTQQPTANKPRKGR
jgi:Zn-dependent peptidase ImmA (M78 family)